MQQILRTTEVLKLIGISRSTLWRLRQENLFPAPVKIRNHTLGWFRHEIDEWLMNHQHK